MLKFESLVLNLLNKYFSKKFHCLEFTDTVSLLFNARLFLLGMVLFLGLGKSHPTYNSWKYFVHSYTEHGETLVGFLGMSLLYSWNSILNGITIFFPLICQETWLMRFKIHILVFLQFFIGWKWEVDSAWVYELLMCNFKFIGLDRIQLDFWGKVCMNKVYIQFNLDQDFHMGDFNYFSSPYLNHLHNSVMAFALLLSRK